MKKIILLTFSGLLLFTFSCSRKQPASQVKESIVSATNPLAAVSLKKYLYRIGMDLDQDGDTLFYVVAYETTPNSGAYKGHYAIFNKYEEVKLKHSASGKSDIVFETATSGKTGYKTLAIVSKSFAADKNIETSGGWLKILSGTTVLDSIEIGRLINIKKDAGGIVIGYVDQNDIDFL